MAIEMKRVVVILDARWAHLVGEYIGERENESFFDALCPQAKELVSARLPMLLAAAAPTADVGVGRVLRAIIRGYGELIIYDDGRVRVWIPGEEE